MNELTTVSCRDLIFAILGDDKNGKEKSEIPHSIASALTSYLEGSVQWIIVYEDENLEPYPSPILWRYSEWKLSLERYERRRKYAQIEREDRFIRDENINRMVRVLVKQFSFDEEHAKPLAYKLVTKGGEKLAREMGVERFVKKIEDI